MTDSSLSHAKPRPFNFAFFLPLVAACLLWMMAGAHAADGETAAAPPPAADVVHFHLLRPDTDHPFWVLFESVMRSACEDLGCSVDVTFADWDRFKMIEQARALGTQDIKPDVVFFQSMKSNGAEIIRALEENNINGFLINAGLTPEQQLEMGKPREKYKHWIGQMMPDDFGAGRMMAQALYKAAKDKGYAQEGIIHFAGIEGNSADGASIERLKGLNSVVNEHEDLELLQVVQGKWDTPLSHDLTNALLRRYPDLHVIWAAGDPIAFGVLDAAREKGLPSGTILTAGTDWAPRALDEIKAGEMVGSAGGHFMEGAWAAICAYDYVKGIDFADSVGIEIKSKMGFLTQKNLPLYLEKFGDSDFSSVDFKKFSQHYGAQPGSYDFDVTELFKQSE